MSRQLAALAPAPAAATASPRAALPGRSYVVDRRGKHVQVRFDEITRRNEDLCTSPEYGPPLTAIDAPLVTAQVITRFRSGITTRELDAITVQVCTGLTTHSLDYSRLAARICVSDLHKRVPACIRATVEAIAAAAPDAASVRYSAEYRGILARRAEAVNARLVHARDYAFTFFGFQTLVRSYLFRAGERVEESSLHHDTLTERPGHLYMRVAIELFCGQADGRGHEAPDAVLDARLERAFRYYDLLSRFRVSNATPTMLNAGTHHRQLSSCFQKAPGDDLRSLGETLTEAMLTSKWSGGVSFRLTGVRPEGALIRSTGGKSSGKKRYIKLLEDVQLYANQGGNRPGAFAVYLEPWDDDIFTFLEMGRHKGVVLNAPDLKYGLWVPDAFMRALERGLAGGEDDWYLFDSAAAPGLHLVWGAEFDALYARYVAEGRHRRKVRARDILTEAVITMGQSGTPYILLKDNANAHSALRHVATITSSNICTETTLLCWSDFEAADFKADAGETGVCNLGAIPLASFVLDEPRDPAEHGRVGAHIDVEGLMEAAELLTEALDNVITLNYYPDELSRRGSTRHRPIGIGEMGLADVLLRLKLAFGSEEAEEVDRALHAAIYYASMRATVRLARERGAFPSLRDQRTRWPSPLAEGRLVPDLWVETGHLGAGWEADIERALGRHLPAAAWEAQRAELRAHGARNCYTTALPPTATTSNIVGQNECFEPYTSNMYTRRVLAGEMTVINHHLVAELTGLGLWTEEVRLAIIAARGSVQGIEAIPPEVRRRFRTARELDPRVIVLASIARGPFVSMSQSLNHYYDDISLETVLTTLMLAWKGGLTTDGYYRYTTPASGGTKAAIAGNGGHYPRGPRMPDAPAMPGAPHVFDATDPESKRGGCTGGVCTV